MMLHTAGIATMLLFFALLAQAETEADKPQRRLSPGQSNAPAAVMPRPTTAGSVAVYKSATANSTTLFSDRPPREQPFEILRFDCFACDPHSVVDWHKTPLYLRPFNRLIDQLAAEYKLEPALLRAVIHAESSFRPQVVSAKGAAGLMQLMPDTARMLGVTDVMVPEQNIRAGTKYLAQLLAQYDGDLRLALAAYNAGPGSVRRHNGMPPFPETRLYVQRVLILHQRYKQALS